MGIEPTSGMSPHRSPVLKAECHDSANAENKGFSPQSPSPYPIQYPIGRIEVPRQAKLGKKNGYWFTQAGGKPRYFGRIDTVPYADALKAFREVLATPEKQGVGASPSPITLAELRDGFLAWLQRHRGERTHYERSRHLARFADHKGNAKRKAIDITSEHLDSFLTAMAKDKATLDYQHKHEVSIRAMFRWGVKHGKLPPGFAPFATVEPIRPPLKALRESDLPTPDEVRSVIAEATPTLANLLRVQYATGARTGELREASVGDYQPSTQQILLAEHKRSKTMREKCLRVIVLNSEANAIVAKLCEKRSPDDPIFTTPWGRRWSRRQVSTHFMKARAKAKARDSFTPYSLRHLWISEALMAGVDLMLVARMAGTSVMMIERVYGRFRSQSLADAQGKLDALRSAQSQAKG